jgi:hypothetical protein
MKHSLFLICYLLFFYACADAEYNNEVRVTGEEKFNIFGGQKILSKDFSLTSELGEEILAYMKQWEVEQIQYKDEYAQPRMCAHNVSRIFDMLGMTEYQSYLVPDMVGAVKVRKGLVKQLSRKNKSKAITELNALFNGKLPIGTLINGCLRADCSGEGGDGHIGILGETDENGVVWVYHNNWYRPDNEGGQRKEYMVSSLYYDQGLFRQWMKTPWIKVYRNEQGQISDLESLLPALDDMDLLGEYFVTVSVIPELLKSLNLLNESDYFCPEPSKADLLLGYCVDGENDQANAYGPFTLEMMKRCSDYGYGNACVNELLINSSFENKSFQVKTPRWSKRVVRSLKGEGACAVGSKIDDQIGYCVETVKDEQGNQVQNAFGPFPKALVSKCVSKQGGNACYQGRWNKNFLANMLK